MSFKFHKPIILRKINLEEALFLGNVSFTELVMGLI